MQLCIATEIELYYAYNIHALLQCDCKKHTYKAFEKEVEPISSQPLQRSRAINSAMHQTKKLICIPLYVYEYMIV